MALQKFRDRQKLIYWGIAIVVIPSFVLLGFSGLFMGDGGSQTVGSAFGKKLSYNEFDQFQRRLFGINHGRPSYFGALTFNQQFQPITNEGVTAYLLYAMTADAKRHGLEVTDEEVGTFIRAQVGYAGNDGKEFQDRIKRALTSRAVPLDDLYSYQLAVREHLLARKFLALLDNSLVIPAPLAELQNAQEHSTYTGKRAVVTFASQREAAAAEIAQLDDAALTARAADFIRSHQTAANRARYPFLWNKSRWQLDYVFAPFIVLGKEPNITDAQIADYYNANKEQFAEAPTAENAATSTPAATTPEKTSATATDAEKLPTATAYQPLAAVREKIVAELRQRARTAQAREVLRRDFRDFIRQRDRTGEHTDIVTVAEINADPRLQELGLKAGNTGAAQTAEEIFTADNADENRRGFAVATFMLDYLDREITQASDAAATPEAKQKAVAEILLPFQRDFRGMAIQGVDNQSPVGGDNGLLEYRVVDYRAGSAKELVVDGERDEALLAAVKEALIGELAEKKALDEAASIAAAWQKNETDDKYPPQTRTAAQLDSAAWRELPNLTIGAVTVPQTVAQPEAGYEVAQLLAVNIPPVNDAAPEVANLRRYETQAGRSNLRYAPEVIPQMNGLIPIGARAFNYFQENFTNGNFTFKPIFQSGADEHEGHSH
ncbi:hypothetical protein AGMMS49959_10310 [Planctomycetales bacterium]|nr:hypothetical protein AGMMS49959_10310 [Planctomycetales bacterium]